jgi:hypothetical protein
MATQIAKIVDRAMILLLHDIGFKSDEIYEILNQIFPKVRPCQTTVDKVCMNIDEDLFSFVDPSPPGRTIDEELKIKVKAIIEENPFLSLRVIASKVGSNKDSVRQILVEVLEMKKRYAKWVPHSLTDVHKLQRVSMAREMLKILKADESQNFCHIITGDESWVLYNYAFR